MACYFFVSDLHGDPHRYELLGGRIVAERPDAVLLGGDLLPHVMDRRWVRGSGDVNFIEDFLAPIFRDLRDRMGDGYPRVLLILGNDDPRCFEQEIIAGEDEGLWEYAHRKRIGIGEYQVVGYSHVPPTPFLLKDWERYDVSRFVDPGCLPPEEGKRSVAVHVRRVRLATIAADLDALVPANGLHRTIMLFHSPPYGGRLDRAALDGRMIDHVPVDVHVGSIAIERMIRARQPAITLHGHVHESARLTGDWRELIGGTHAFSAAHDGPELALVRFDPARPADAERALLP